MTLLLGIEDYQDPILTQSRSTVHIKSIVSLTPRLRSLELRKFPVENPIYFAYRLYKQRTLGGWFSYLRFRRTASQFASYTGLRPHFLSPSISAHISISVDANHIFGFNAKDSHNCYFDEDPQRHLRYLRKKTAKSKYEAKDVWCLRPYSIQMHNVLLSKPTVSKRGIYPQFFYEVYELSTSINCTEHWPRWLH